MLRPRVRCAANLERLLVPWLRLILCCVILLLSSSPASAHTVVLLRSASHSPATTELVERLRGELLSLGFEVAVRDRPEVSADAAVHDPWARALAAERTFDAAVDLGGETIPAGVDVWIVDSEQHFQLLARVKLDPNNENPLKGLAIRASEVLRARLFETRAGNAGSPPSDTRPPPPARDVEADDGTAQQSAPLGFELGAAALTSLDGVGPALLPLVRFDWAIEPKLLLQATLAGFGTQPSVVTPAGSADVAMQYGLFGACYRLNWAHRVRPLAALSLGALRTAVVGEADLPGRGHSVQQWSFLLDASLGAVWQLSQRYAVVLAGHVQLAEPYVAIRFGDQKVAGLGRPNLLVSLTFGVWP